MKTQPRQEKAVARDAVCDRARKIYAKAEIDARRDGLMPHEMAMGLAFRVAELESVCGAVS